MAPPQGEDNYGVKKGYIRFIAKIYIYIFKSSLLSGYDQTNWGYSNNTQGRVNQKCKFYDPKGRGSCAKAWPYKSSYENELFL